MVIDQLSLNGNADIVPLRHKALLLSADPAGDAEITELLDHAGFDVDSVRLEERTLDAVSQMRPRVIVLHLQEIKDESLEICKQMRQSTEMPIVICSASGREWDIVRGLEAGADEYLVMPLRTLEFAARLRAVMRRVGENEYRGDTLVAGPVELRLDEHRAYRNGGQIDLTPTEFRLLVTLVRKSGQAVSHTELLTQAWGPEYAGCRNYLRMYMRYLRNKIEEDPHNPRLIVSEWGVGYRFEAAAA